MKTCSKCKVEKGEDNFYFGSGKLLAWCKQCLSDSRREHYLNSRQRNIDRATNNQRARVEKFKEYKDTLKCAYCSEDEAACLDFHHTDINTKEFSISNRIRVMSWKRLMEEIEKCVVVCANCHRKIHAGKL